MSKSYNYKPRQMVAINSPDWESEKAIGIDGEFTCELLNHKKDTKVSNILTESIRFFIPKSLVYEGKAPKWFILDKAEELNLEMWGNRPNIKSTLIGILADDLPITFDKDKASIEKKGD